MRKPSLFEVKKGMDAVRAVHNCPECSRHLDAIKECKERGHKQ